VLYIAITSTVLRLIDNRLNPPRAMALLADLGIRPSKCLQCGISIVDSDGSHCAGCNARLAASGQSNAAATILNDAAESSANPEHDVLAMATAGLIGDKRRATLRKEAKKQERLLRWTFAIAMIVAIPLTVFVHDWGVLLLPLLFIAAYFYARHIRKKQKHFYARRLYESGIRPHFCLSCNYSLTGIDRTDCPECGHALAAATVREPALRQDY
jgi:predicted Zn-ribbon and HTH transcriptional regulator